MDAGATGFLLFGCRPLGGRRPTDARAAAVVEGVPPRRRPPRRVHGAPRMLSSLRYEVMYFLEGRTRPFRRSRTCWPVIGDSIVVVGGDGIWNCHIHTNDIERASIEARSAGAAPSSIRVTDLIERSRRSSGWGRGPTSTAPSPNDWCHGGDGGLDGRRHQPHLPLPGGAAVVAGGPTMNPRRPTCACGRASCPRGRSAEQQEHHPGGRAARRLGGEDGAVVPTRGSPRASPPCWPTTPTPAAFAENARCAWRRPHVGDGGRRCCATPCRDSSAPEAGPIKEGDWLGIARDGIQVVSPSLSRRGDELLENLVAGMPRSSR